MGVGKKATEVKSPSHPIPSPPWGPAVLGGGGVSGEVPSLPGCLPGATLADGKPLLRNSCFCLSVSPPVYLLHALGHKPT